MIQSQFRSFLILVVINTITRSILNKKLKKRNRIDNSSSVTLTLHSSDVFVAAEEELGNSSGHFCHQLRTRTLCYSNDSE